jgi:hypothetical protein
MAAPPAPSATVPPSAHIHKTPTRDYEIRSMSYQEARRFADSADKARLVAFAKGWKPGWVYYRVRELAGGGAS